MLNVLIAEDNVPISVLLLNTINTNDVRCLGILNEGTKVYKKVKELNPDVLILDLKMPGKNGLEVLQEIEDDATIKTKVFIYSGETEYLEKARDFKCVERFFSKLTPPEEISRQLQEISEGISNKNIGKQISEMLFSMGFTYSLKGTRLINACILYSIVEDEDNVNKIYIKIAKEKGQNVHTLKSDINTAITTMWRYTDKKKTREILRLGSWDTPSSKGIISMVKYHITN